MSIQAQVEGKRQKQAVRGATETKDELIEGTQVYTHPTHSSSNEASFSLFLSLRPYNEFIDSYQLFIAFVYPWRFKFVPLVRREGSTNRYFHHLRHQFLLCVPPLDNDQLAGNQGGQQYLQPPFPPSRSYRGHRPMHHKKLEGVARNAKSNLLAQLIATKRLIKIHSYFPQTI